MSRWGSRLGGAVLVFLILATLQLPLAPTAAAPASIPVSYTYSPECLGCQHSWPVLKKALDEAPVPVQLSRHDITTREGAQYASQHGIASVPAVEVGNGPPLLLESYHNTEEFGQALKAALAGAAMPAPVDVSRNASRGAGGLVTVNTYVTCRAADPVNVSVAGGLPEGAALVSGEQRWSGVLQPGETASISYSAHLPRNTKALPPPAVSYTDARGWHAVQAPELLVHPGDMTGVGAFTAGLIAGFNPCVLAIMAFIAGTTLAAAAGRGAILARIVAFCGGLMAVYLLIGIGLLELVRSAPALADSLKAGIILLVAGLALWSFYDAYLAARGAESHSLQPILRRLKPVYQKYSLPASFLIGAAFGLVKMPCVGGMYIAILGSLLDAGTALEGFLCLVAYNLGIIVPVLALGVLITIGLSPAAVNAFRLRHRVGMKAFTGLLLAGMAAGMALGAI